MAKYRKKSIVIEAVQVPISADDTEGWAELGQFLGMSAIGPEPPVIETLEGDMASVAGGWVIKGVKGEFYPCKPDIFPVLYDMKPVVTHLEDSPHLDLPVSDDDPCLSKWQPLPGNCVGKYKLTLDQPDGTRSGCAFSALEEIPDALEALSDMVAAQVSADVKQETMDGSSALIDEKHVRIKFQLGPIKESGENGTTIEYIISLLIDRLEGFQAGPFSCAANAKALAGLHRAIASLGHRTVDRQARGVEGTNQV